MNRFRNYGLWLGVGSFSVIAMQTFGVGIDFGQYTHLYNSVLDFFVVAGILNNPSIGTGFKDK